MVIVDAYAAGLLSMFALAELCGGHYVRGMVHVAVAVMLLEQAVRDMRRKGK